jgi:hypothetical protein
MINEDFNEKNTDCLKLLKLLSCMYLYTATMPEEIYISTVRKFMCLYHIAFSAKWGKDYASLKEISRQYCTNANSDVSAEIKKLIFDSINIHFTIAAKLVKDKKSLLQISSSNQENHIANYKDSDIVYDNFFMVKRLDSVSESQIIESLIKRLVILRTDIKKNGFFDKSDKNIDHILSNQLAKNYVDNFDNIVDDVIGYYTDK